VEKSASADVFLSESMVVCVFDRVFQTLAVFPKFIYLDLW
jgi:hypothetical protein